MLKLFKFSTTVKCQAQMFKVINHDYSKNAIFATTSKFMFSLDDL